MGAFRRPLEAVKGAGLFKRNKVSLEVKVRAMVLYLAGLSTRGMTERYGLIKASREAVRLWVHKLESLAYHGPPRPRRLVAIDETKAKLMENGFTYGPPSVPQAGHLRLLAALGPECLHIPPHGPEGLRQQAVNPGRWRPMVSMGPGAARPPMAPRDLRRAERHRALLQDAQGAPEGLPLQLERQGQGPIGRGGDGSDPGLRL